MIFLHDSFAKMSKLSLSNISKSLIKSNKKLRSFLSIKTRPPNPPGPEECCNNDCAQCVWIVFENEIEIFFNKNSKAKLEYLKRCLDQEKNEISKTFIKFIINKNS